MWAARVMLPAVELPLFDEVAEVVRGLVPRELGPVRARARRQGVKAWFGPEQPPREHFEAQLIVAPVGGGGRGLALEIGYHAEHPRVEDNDAAVARLLRRERTWRRALGPQAVAGAFIGREDLWRRVSETWPDPDLDDAGLALEVGTRLTDYIAALEPVVRR